MSSLSLLGVQRDNEEVMCPYNASHRMNRKRLQAHLIKCRIQYPDVELQKCPFNQTHLVPQPEFELHVTSCPDRKLISQYRFEATGSTKPEDVNKHKPIDCEDNWDDDDVEDYNPQLRIANDPTILRLPGMSAAVRKRSSDSTEDEPEEKKFIPNRVIKRSASATDENDSERPATPPPPQITHWPSFRKEQHGSKSRSRSRSRSRSPLNRQEEESERKFQPANDYNADDDPYYKSNNSFQRRKK